MSALCTSTPFMSPSHLFPIDHPQKHRASFQHILSLPYTEGAPIEDDPDAPGHQRKRVVNAALHKLTQSSPRERSQPHHVPLCQPVFGDRICPHAYDTYEHCGRRHGCGHLHNHHTNIAINTALLSCSARRIRKNHLSCCNGNVTNTITRMHSLVESVSTRPSHISAHCNLCRHAFNELLLQRYHG